MKFPAGEPMRWIPPAAAAGLGLYQLGEPSFWIDEALTARAMSHDAGQLVTELHLLYYTAMKPWTALAGTGEFALRLPSVLGAVLAVLLLYGLAKRMLGERVAFVASLLFAFNPMLVKWSQQARSYTFLVAFAIGSTWLLLRALERKDRLAWAAYGLSSIVLIVLQFFSAFLLLPVHAFFAWRSRQARFVWALVLVAATPWLVLRLGRGEEGAPTSWLERPGLEDISKAALSVSGAFVVGLVLAAAGAFWVDRRWRTLLLAWAVAPFGLSLALASLRPVFLDRYLIVSAPAFAVLAAVALVTLGGRIRIAATGVVAAATAVGLVLWYMPADGDNWKGQNWRAATAYVDGRAQVVPNWEYPAFVYYGGRFVPQGWIIAGQDHADEQEAAAFVREHAREEAIASFGSNLHVYRRDATRVLARSAASQSKGT